MLQAMGEIAPSCTWNEKKAYATQAREPASPLHVASFLIVFSTTLPRFSPPVTAVAKDWRVKAGDTVWAAFLPRQSTSKRDLFSNKDAISLIWGDSLDENSRDTDGMTAAAALLQLDFRECSLKVTGTIVGLPPIFVYDEGGIVIISSSMSHIVAFPGIRKELDVAAIEDLFRIGYPIQHRTLLQQVKLLPAGHALRISAGKRKMQRELSPVWQAPGPSHLIDECSLRDRQVQTFEGMVDRISAHGSYLSLTGGLDTRAILAAFVHKGITIPAVTLSGENLSLDARIARALARHYGFRHEIIHLGDAFLKNLPECVVAASKLTGGVAGLEQAHEVYFYDQAKNLGFRRISGNLGNQIGRGGLEGIRMRNAELGVLNKDIWNGTNSNARQHWLGDMEHAGTSSLDRLLRYEIPFTMQANYAIGQMFAQQTSPYASRELIQMACETCTCVGETAPFSAFRSRVRALHHAFLGEGIDSSFQRKYICHVGGFVSECPINWGWRAKGGVSGRGVLWGMGAFTEALASFSNPISKAITHLLPSLGAQGLYEIRNPHRWLSTYLKEFTCDILSSQSVINSGIFNADALRQTLRGHYINRKNYAPTIMSALDLALFFRSVSGQDERRDLSRPRP